MQLNHFLPPLYRKLSLCIIILLLTNEEWYLIPLLNNIGFVLWKKQENIAVFSTCEYKAYLLKLLLLLSPAYMHAQGTAIIIAPHTGE